jgi:hypothetical protein
MAGTAATLDEGQRLLGTLRCIAQDGGERVVREEIRAKKPTSVVAANEAHELIEQMLYKDHLEYLVPILKEELGVLSTASQQADAARRFFYDCRKAIVFMRIGL